jgi:hypothetical protein
MRTGPDFRQILDEKLEGGTFAWASCQEQPPAGTWRPGPRPVFLYGDRTSGFSACPGGSARVPSVSGASPRTPVYGAGTGAQFRPARRLTPAQRGALDALRSLGASVGDDFTSAEIKSAFRALARRFHPDRHPWSTDTERTAFARAFASACDAYRTLTTAVH